MTDNNDDVRLQPLRPKHLANNYQSSAGYQPPPSLSNSSSSYRMPPSLSSLPSSSSTTAAAYQPPPSFAGPPPSLLSSSSAAYQPPPPPSSSLVGRQSFGPPSLSAASAIPSSSISYQAQPSTSYQAQPPSKTYPAQPSSTPFHAPPPTTYQAQPSSTAYQPSLSSYQPPSSTSYQPPPSSYQPPSSHQPSLSSYQPPPSCPAPYQPEPSYQPPPGFFAGGSLQTQYNTNGVNAGPPVTNSFAKPTLPPPPLYSSNGQAPVYNPAPMYNVPSAHTNNLPDDNPTTGYSNTNNTNSTNNTGGLKKSSSNSRIDPSQMPRPPKPQFDMVFHTKTNTNSHKVPPLSHVSYTTIDSGYCSPRFCRLTTVAPPCSDSIRVENAIPFSFIASPFADPQYGEEAIKRVDLGGHVPRCARCLAYVNPSVTWSEGGHKWQCNLCYVKNDTPDYYFSSLDGNGKRIDEPYRPELMRGSIEYIVSKDYCFRDIQNPVFLFVIDISPLAVKTGLTISSIDAIRSVIPFLTQGSKIGIITYDNNIHFYHVKEKDSGNYTISISITDPDDPVPCFPQSQFVCDTNNNDKIDYLLDTIISKVSSDNTNNNFNNLPFCCPIAAVKVAQVALERTGGKILLFASHYSTIGFGVTKNKESIASYSTSSEFFLYGNIDQQQGLRQANNSDATTYKEFTTLGQGLASSQTCLHIIINPLSLTALYIDIPYYSYITDICGGKLHVLEGIMTNDDNVIRLNATVNDIISSMRGSDAIIKLRTSVGIAIDDIISKGQPRQEAHEIELAGVDNDVTLCYNLKNDTVLKDDDKVEFQLAILYTSLDMQRIVRVHNISYISSTNSTVIFKHTDLDAVMTSLTKRAVKRMLMAPADEKKGARPFLIESLIDILYKYRIKCSPTSSRGQLILPESLKILPLYILGLLKHPSFIENQPISNKSNRPDDIIANLLVRGHERAYQLSILRTSSINSIINTIHPQLYNLKGIDENDRVARGGIININESLSKQFPSMVPLSSEMFESDSIYLLVDGINIYIYVGRNVGQDILASWFDFNGNMYGRPSSVSINANGAGMKLHSIIEGLRAVSPNKYQTLVVWGDGSTSLNTKFSLRLVEDSIYGVHSYVDFLCNIHSKVQGRYS